MNEQGTLGARNAQVTFMMPVRDEAIRAGDLGIWYTSGFLFKELFSNIEEGYRTFMDLFRYKYPEVARNYKDKEGKVVDESGYARFKEICDRIERLHSGRGELDVVISNMIDGQPIPEIIDCNLSMSQIKPQNYGVVRRQMPGMDMIEEIEKIPSTLIVPGFRMNRLECDHFLSWDDCPIRNNIPCFDLERRKALKESCKNCVKRKEGHVYCEQVYKKKLKQPFHATILTFIQNEFSTCMGAFNELASVQARGKRHMVPNPQDKDYMMLKDKLFVPLGENTKDPNIDWQETVNEGLEPVESG